MNLDIESVVAQQVQQAVSNYLDNNNIAELVSNHINETVKKSVAGIVQSAIGELLDNKNISEEIERLILLNANDRLKTMTEIVAKQQLAGLDLKKLVNSVVKEQLKLDIENYDFPDNSIPSSSVDFRGFTLSAGQLVGGTLKEFNSTGIQDLATNTKFILTDDTTAIDNTLVAPALIVDQAVHTQDMIVTGILEVGKEVIDNGGLGDFVTTKTADILKSKLQELDIGDGAIKANGRNLISYDELGGSVTTSNLRKVGNLVELVVTGDAKFSETLNISQGGKVSINSETAAGALTVWDGDAEFSFLKNSQKTMFAGSTRATDVSIGTNNKPHINLLNDGLTEITTPLRLQGLKITMCDDIPEHVGEPNEVGIHKTAKPGQPFVYVCRGGNNWAAVVAI